MATEVLEDLLEEDDEVVEVCIIVFFLSFLNGSSFDTHFRTNYKEFDKSN